MQYEDKTRIRYRKRYGKVFELMKYRNLKYYINILRDLIVMYEYRWNI